ncbi:MAG: hypothetical protein M5U13_16465 [Thermoanaerobaculia bacterium]|nr:hypothetical protein [Thermoanaerobaculia bacterium]
MAAVKRNNLLTGVLVSFLLVVGSAAAAADSNNWYAAPRQTFSSAGHPKSKGVSLRISYPASWKASEGERPNIVQKFASDGGSGWDFLMITTKDLPLDPRVELTAEDLEALLAPSALREMAPDGATVKDARRTRIEAMPAGLLEYRIRGERLGVVVVFDTIALIFVSGHTLVQVSLQSTSASVEQGAEPGHWRDMKALFLSIANSLVVEERWR